MQPMRVTRAAEQDAELLTALVRGSGAYRGRYASIVSDYRVTADYVRRHRVFTAVEPGGRVLGFYALVLDPPELDLMFVADAAQGTGVGRLLVEHMLGQAREAGLTGVRVVSHPPAEGFYRRLGAERVGTVAPAPPKVGWERPELWFAVNR
ncbi:GNAT family N-acetyltransferase [Streptomyces sudanensis]|uniref:GNAT family N-acetyltransferase n=1 Tax=Streptomyces sudanensis TaxID=436397 RepID=UPI0020CF8709|nr:GNAT family N-acetyltransferase [Streptomyces sudanensis]MCP9960175.1 GNAT family N-acetyltransferase [Streptomyces sudanensis]MCP9989172.1 GNAT family N-acetyltransferase [Streptomyces sudanensis]MCP9999455.1 GNAT family N-acetyltransferase [Streptomyces sudanensis]